MLRPGEKVNQRYIVRRTISTGLLSNVYEAEDSAIGRRVVLKELVSDKNRPSTARIEREVALYARLRHPNILELLDAIVADATVYLILPFIEGPTLAELISRGPVSMPRALGIARDIAGAVAFIHSRGIIHRDLKPMNILVDDQRAVLADFGIAKDTAADTNLAVTATGQVLGTPLYLAPEGLRGEQVGPPADVYAFGVSLFELFAGVPPYSGKSVHELVAKRLKSAPPTLASVQPAIPAAVSLLVQQMLEDQPAARPTAAQVCDALTAIDDASPMPAAPAVPATPSELRYAATLEMSPVAGRSLPGNAGPVTPPSPAPVPSAPPFPPPPPVPPSATITPELAKTIVFRGREVTDTLQERPETEGRGFFADELARQDELKRSREFYRLQLSEDYGNLMFQAKVSFWLWVLFSVVGFGVFITGVGLLYLGRWQEGTATLVSESIVVFIQKLFKDREDEFRERAAKKNRHVELGNLWNLAAQSLDGLDPATRREKLGKLTDALIGHLGE